MIKFDTKHAPPVSKSQGFTLIELMVTIAVLAIIVSIAAPNISTQLANQRVKSTTATLENALKEARAESVIRRQNITVTINSNPNSIVLTDPSSDNDDIASYNYDKKTRITPASAAVAFKINKTADEVTFTICDNNAKASPRQVVVSKIGNIVSQSEGGCS